MSHEHAPDHTMEVCSCGATRSPEGEWADPAGQALVRRYIERSTPEERAANARKSAATRWAGKELERNKFLRKIARRPRPNARIQDRCPCGKYSRAVAEKRGHKCEAAA